MILLDHAPYTPYLVPRTAHPPGLSPLDPSDWTVVLPDFAEQMAYRATLIADKREVVIANEASAASTELLAEVLEYLGTKPDYRRQGNELIRPDGAKVPLDLDDPLATLGHLVAEDFCLLLPDTLYGEYRLVAAVLCFPSRWLLSEKMGQPLTEIHAPVPDYDATLAARVNRVFDALRPGRPLVRVNWLVHAVPELHLPMGHSDKLFQQANPEGPFFFRSERQTLTRLPDTRAVAFGIKTSVTPIEKLSSVEAAGLAAALAGLDERAMAYRAGARVLGNAVAALHKIACEKGV